MASAKVQVYVAEFQRRRQAYWRIAAPSLFLVVVAVGLLVAKVEVARWVSLAIFGFGLAGLALGSHISKYPRCPRCETSVLPGEGWFPRPEKCQTCNLDLRGQAVGSDN
jgi:hypothetical protein